MSRVLWAVTALRRRVTRAPRFQTRPGSWRRRVRSTPAWRRSPAARPRRWHRSSGSTGRCGGAWRRRAWPGRGSRWSCTRRKVSAGGRAARAGAWAQPCWARGAPPLGGAAPAVGAARAATRGRGEVPPWHPFLLLLGRRGDARGCPGSSLRDGPGPSPRPSGALSATWAEGGGGVAVSGGSSTSPGLGRRGRAALPRAGAGHALGSGVSLCPQASSRGSRWRRPACRRRWARRRQPNGTSWSSWRA